MLSLGMYEERALDDPRWSLDRRRLDDGGGE
jgi:hypothetical protein